MDLLFRKTEFFSICREISKAITELLIASRLKGEPLDREVGLGADGAPTHQVDALAERKAIELLERSGFCGRIVTEEQGILQFGESEDTIWLDPIDGTRNAYRNFPYYAWSIAHFQKNTFKSGYIRNLANGDEFLALEGSVTLNGIPLKTIARSPKKVGIAAIRPRTKKGFVFLHTLQQRVRFLRILGAAALDIAYIASGAVDAFLDLDRGLKTVDYAAAKPLLELAGGVVSDLRGQPIRLQEDLTVRVKILAASHKQLHSMLLGLLKEFEYVS